MDRARVETILRRHHFTQTEQEDFFEAMSCLLEEYGDHLKETEPYARKDIEGAERLSRTFCTFDSFIDELEESNKRRDEDVKRRTQDNS